MTWLRAEPRASVAMVILGACLATGCGGGEGDASSGFSAGDPASLSKAGFIREANAICEREQAGLTKRVSSFERLRAGRPPRPYADMVHSVFLPMMEAQEWKIRALIAPRGQAGKVDAMLDAERAGVDAVAVIPRVPSIAVAIPHFANADRLFRTYGLSVCISPSARQVEGK